ncbi:MAG: polysaccharide biosynthesis tyrosine autokinase [Candidatus Tectomicrobia bacterium]|nr:polysaccharide biosynthesis tyrosine autokinase [Candidatus Tectomicrobia bacterium]
MATYEFNIRDYWHIIRKRKMVVIFTIVMLGFFSFAFGSLRKPIPIYRATSAVKIDQNVGLAGRYFDSGTAAAGDNLETQAMIIQSFPIMERVARQLKIVSGEGETEEVRNSNEYLNQILAIKGQVNTSQEGFTNIINVHATSRDPRFAQKLANAVAEVYRDFHNSKRNQRKNDTREFIEKQLLVYRQRLAEGEEEVRQYRERHNIVSIDAQSGQLLTQRQSVEDRQKLLEASLRDLDSVERELRNTRNLQQANLGTFFAEGVSGMFGRLHARLTELNLQRDTLLLQFTKEHPQVQDMNLQIEEVLMAMTNELKGHRDSLRFRLKEVEATAKGLEEYSQRLPQLGLELARLQRRVALNGELYTFLERKYQEALINESEKVEEVSIVRPALLPTEPINQPSVVTTTMVGIVLGGILGLVFAFILETLDTSIGRIEDIESYLDVPVLGVIPYFEIETHGEEETEPDGGRGEQATRQSRALLSSFYSQNSSAAEAYRSLRTNVQFLLRERNLKTIVVSSTTPREGKSTIAVNTAVAMALVGLRTLLIDCDLRRPSIARYFGIENDLGFTDIIVGNSDWRETVKTVADIIMGQMGLESVLNTPGIDNLNLIVSGKVPLNPTEMLNSKRAEELIREISADYDVVLIDTPPILPVTDAVVLGSKVDGVILVYLAGETGRKSLMHAKGQMDAVRAEVLGIVLNGLKSAMSPDYMDYGYYHYYGQAEEEGKVGLGEEGFGPLQKVKRLFGRLTGSGKKAGSAVASEPEQEFEGLGMKTRGSAENGRSLTKTLFLFLAVAALLVGYILAHGQPPRQSEDIIPQRAAVRTSQVSSPAETMPDGVAPPPAATVAAPVSKVSAVPKAKAPARAAGP